MSKSMMNCLFNKLFKEESCQTTRSMIVMIFRLLWQTPDATQHLATAFTSKSSTYLGQVIESPKSIAYFEGSQLSDAFVHIDFDLSSEVFNIQTYYLHFLKKQKGAVIQPHVLLIDLRSRDEVWNGRLFSMVELCESMEILIKGNQDKVVKMEVATSITDHIYFATTRKFYSWLFIVFILGFAVPYMVASFTLDQDIQLMAYKCCIPVCALFIVLELIKLQTRCFSGTSFINLTMISSFSLNLYMVTYHLEEYEQAKLMTTISNLHKLSEVVLIACIFANILIFLRVYKQFGLLLRLFTLIVEDLGPLSVLYLLFIVASSLIYIKLEADFKEMKVPGNPHPYVQILFQTFANTLKKSIFPNDQYWRMHSEEFPIQSSIGIWMLWSVYFLNLIILAIMMMKFIVTLVAETYKASLKNY